MTRKHALQPSFIRLGLLGKLALPAAIILASGLGEPRIAHAEGGEKVVISSPRRRRFSRRSKPRNAAS